MVYLQLNAGKFGKAYGVKSCAAFGGLDKYRQLKELRAGVDIAVCTPGRMIDLIKMKACNTKRITFVVLDEADRMFDMGFEPQVRSLLGQIRPDRQNLLFSATMPPKVEKLASEVLQHPVKVIIGRAGSVNVDITQHIYLLNDVEAKKAWLCSKIESFIDQGDVLIFSNQKTLVEDIVETLKSAGIQRVAALHGDMDQHTRMKILNRFKKEGLHVLVATDIAARGIDIHSIKVVVNFDAPKDSDTYVHRIGRTGRASDKDGEAHTLLLPNQPKQASDICEYMYSAGQNPPSDVVRLSKQYRRNKRKRGPNPMARSAGIGATQSTTTPAAQGGTKVTNQNNDGRLFNKFVSSGIQGSQESLRPQIIAPKVANKKSSHVQPPIPVHEQPLYLGSRPSASTSSLSADAVQEAIAKAQAVAQRLAASAPPEKKGQSKWS